MASDVKANSSAVLIIAVVAVVLGLIGLSLVTSKSDEDSQVFVDIEANWTAGREVDVLWIVGTEQGEAHFEPGERPHFGIRRVAQRGWVVSVIVTPKDEHGTISCFINADEQELVSDEVQGLTSCSISTAV